MPKFSFKATHQYLVEYEIDATDLADALAQDSLRENDHYLEDLATIEGRFEITDLEITDAAGRVLSEEDIGVAYWEMEKR